MSLKIKKVNQLHKDTSNTPDLDSTITLLQNLIKDFSFTHSQDNYLALLNKQINLCRDNLSKSMKTIDKYDVYAFNKPQNILIKHMLSTEEMSWQQLHTLLMQINS